MGEYIGNVAMVFGDGDVNTIKASLEALYSLTVDSVQIVTENKPYQGEIRTQGNTLVHIATETTLKRDYYTVEYITSTLPLKAVQMPTEALTRANLVLVVLKDDDGKRFYFPYSNGLYQDPEDY